jgi:transposase-like protein
MSGYSQEQEKSYAVVAETRRKWSEAERKQIVAETEVASVSSVARKHRLAASLVFRWRAAAGLAGKKSEGKDPSAFVLRIQTREVSSRPPKAVGGTSPPSPQGEASVCF